MKCVLPLFALLVLSSCSNTIYVVRHAEKAAVEPGASQMMASDPPLSEKDQLRALQLKEVLKHKHIRFIYSTNYKRTISTAKPLSEWSGFARIETYGPQKDSMDAFISKLKAIKKGNVLVVGHSNTIDDIANKLSGSIVVPGDLKDTDYDNLYQLKRKGDQYRFKGKTYGEPTK